MVMISSAIPVTCFFIVLFLDCSPEASREYLSNGVLVVSAYCTIPQMTTQHIPHALPAPQHACV